MAGIVRPETKFEKRKPRHEIYRAPGGNIMTADPFWLRGQEQGGYYYQDGDTGVTYGEGQEIPAEPRSTMLISSSVTTRPPGQEQAPAPSAPTPEETAPSPATETTGGPRPAAGRERAPAPRERRPALGPGYGRAQTMRQYRMAGHMGGYGSAGRAAMVRRRYDPYRGTWGAGFF